MTALSQSGIDLTFTDTDDLPPQLPRTPPPPPSQTELPVTPEPQERVEEEKEKKTPPRVPNMKTDGMTVEEYETLKGTPQFIKDLRECGGGNIHLRAKRVDARKLEMIWIDSATWMQIGLIIVSPNSMVLVDEFENHPCMIHWDPSTTHHGLIAQVKDTFWDHGTSAGFLLFLWEEYLTQGRTLADLPRWICLERWRTNWYKDGVESDDEDDDEMPQSQSQVSPTKSSQQNQHTEPERDDEEGDDVNPYFGVY
jgi:hypothetical protein